MRYGKKIKQTEEDDSHFAGKYIDYASLKKAIKDEKRRRAEGEDQQQVDPRETSITATWRPQGGAARRTGRELFDILDREVRCALCNLPMLGPWRVPQLHAPVTRVTVPRSLPRALLSRASCSSTRRVL